MTLSNGSNFQTQDVVVLPAAENEFSAIFFRDTQSCMKIFFFIIVRWLSIVRGIVLFSCLDNGCY